MLATPRGDQGREDMQRVHENKPYKDTNEEVSRKRDARAKEVTSKFLKSLGYEVVDDRERYSKYDLAVKHPVQGELKVECEDRLNRDWYNMVNRRFPDFRIYKRKVNPKAEWYFYMASCGDCHDRILITTFKDISESETLMITNCSWGKPEPVYVVPKEKWVCFNLKTLDVEWGDNPAVLDILKRIEGRVSESLVADIEGELVH